MLPLRDNIPTARTPYVTYALIVANVLVYFFWQQGGLSLGDPSGAHYICQPAGLGGDPVRDHAPRRPGADRRRGCRRARPPTYLTLFTAMFMHGGLLHLGGNMLFLWIFGNNVEDAMGPVKFIVFYLLAGSRRCAAGRHRPELAGADARRLGRDRGRARRLHPAVPAGPRVTVIFIVFFFTILELPALLVLGFWFLQQAVFGALRPRQPAGGGGGVAYFAHVGGFVFGLAAIRLFASAKACGRDAAGWPRHRADVC